MKLNLNFLTPEGQQLVQPLIDNGGLIGFWGVVLVVGIALIAIHKDDQRCKARTAQKTAEQTYVPKTSVWRSDTHARPPFFGAQR